MPSPVSAQLHYTSCAEALRDAEVHIFCGSLERLRAQDVRALAPGIANEVWDAMLDELQPGDAGASTETWHREGNEMTRVVLLALPDRCSRHNSPAQPHAIARGLRQRLRAQGKTAVLLALEAPEHAFAATCAVARALPQYGRKTADASDPATVAVGCVLPDGAEAPDLEAVAATAEGIRLAARLVDTPTSELTTDTFLEELESMAAMLQSQGVTLDVLRGPELEEKGYGGIWNVGKTAVHPPSLAILNYTPEGATDTVCWVGKGIVYDTGGLSIKGKEHMPGMKADMGGAAAVAGAFAAAVRTGYKGKLHALFCLAENSVGPAAMRPDDVIAMYSGKTVEVNNTDAEGRLVLGDGVAHAVRHLQPDVIVDLATLTGAQLVATGRRHAGIVANDETLEARAVRAGRASGDLVHPLPYCPEFYRAEFKSEVADLKNSVRDRSNAQSSCAAQFIAEHLGDFEGSWLHVDLAGPAGSEERGTGFGVALLMELFAR